MKDQVKHPLSCRLIKCMVLIAPFLIVSLRKWFCVENICTFPLCHLAAIAKEIATAIAIVRWNHDRDRDRDCFFFCWSGPGSRSKKKDRSQHCYCLSYFSINSFVIGKISRKEACKTEKKSWRRQLLKRQLINYTYPTHPALWFYFKKVKITSSSSQTSTYNIVSIKANIFLVAYMLLTLRNFIFLAI
jgi:hypothetical protein